MRLGGFVRQAGLSLGIAALSSNSFGEELIKIYNHDDKWTYPSSIVNGETYIGGGSERGNVSSLMGKPSGDFKIRNVSLGENGFVTLKFSGCISNGEGHDLEVGELQIPEPIRVFVSTSLNPYKLVDLGVFERKEGNPFKIDFDNFGLNYVNKVRIQSVVKGSYPPYAGPDIDYVKLRKGDCYFNPNFALQFIS